jgi:hypothetical protein
MGVELITKKKNLNFKQDKDNIELKTPTGGGASVEVDETLTKQGAAADAKATGDMFRNYNAFGEVTSKEFTFPTAEGYHSFSGRLGLIYGEMYTIETIVDDEVVHTYEEIGYPDMSGIGSYAYSVGMEVLVSLEDETSAYFVLVDGIDYDVDANEFEYCDNYVIESWGEGVDYVDTVTVRITGKFINTVPIESLPVRNFLTSDDYFIPTTGAVYDSIKSLEDRVAQKVSNFNVVKASTSIPFGFPTGSYNRADIRMVGFVNGGTDVLFDINVNHSSGNGDVHILDESGYVVRYLNITPDEIKGTTGTYYCVLDIQELTMSNGVVHTKIKSTFYKYEDGSTTHKEGLANQVYTKEIDTIFFYAGRSSFSNIPKGGLVAADEENTSFTEFRGKACYYKL